MLLLQGGGKYVNNTAVVQEVLSWIEYKYIRTSYWQRVYINLPEPMWAFAPTIADNHFVIYHRS